MDESTYQKIADVALRAIEKMLDEVDAEDVDCERSGDVVTLTFKSGKKAVINTQRPTRQIWLAANARAWHFSFDQGTSRWLDDKGEGVELFRKIAAVIQESSGIAVTLP